MAVEAAGEPVAWETLGQDRSRVRLWTPSESAARGLVQRLRSLGVSALQGPPDAAHEIGWDRRNAATTIDERLAVGFPWSPEPDNVERFVAIDPGVGFGTGSHPSTRLLLEVLSARLEGGESVADIGCGSGVLAVAAAVLGASTGVGIDINVPGLDAARRNAGANGVDDRITFSDQSLAELVEVGRQFDVVVANIHAPILREMGPDLTALVTPGGWLGLSGLSPAQVSRVEAALPDVEFEAPRNHTDGWSALVGSPPG